MYNFLKEFRTLSEKQPYSIAVVDQGGRRETSFAEMKLLTDRVTGRLLSRGFPRGSFILINMGRCREYIAAYLGIIAAGYAVVPTVPDYPEERIRYIIRNSGSPFTVTEKFFEGIEAYDSVDGTGPDPEDIACMNYTSGSIGNPKGVCYSMRCISEGAGRAGLLFEGLDRIVMASSASFAFAAMSNDCLGPLLLGGTVHLLSDEVRKDAKLMMEYYEKHGIVCGNVSPGMQKFFGHTKELKRVFTTGERVVNTYSGQHEIWCLYGLTEVFTAATRFLIDRKYPNTPLGKPFGSVRIDILDDDGNPVPEGREGEIFVSGYISEGYYGMPEETARCFTDLGGGMKRFATHDIGYMDENGDLVYVDRKDWMVKINGQRVEPFEIEAVLNEVPGVQSAVVKSFKEEDSVYLCAYYIPEDDGLKEEDIRSAVAAKLPSYMMPAFFVRMDAFPRTVSQKVDRKALKAPSHSDFLKEYAPPENPAEKAVCEAMQKVLKIERVGRNDDFFALGGDSLKVMEMITVLKSESLVALDIVERRTPAAIAEVMSREVLIDTGSDAECRKKTYPLTRYQEHFYRYCKYAGNIIIAHTPDLLAIEAGLVSPEKLADAVYTVLQNHPALSTLIHEEEDGVPRQSFDPTIITRPDILTCTEQEFEKIREGLVRPFNLQGHKLYRCEIYSTDLHSYLFLDLHHIVTDALSYYVLIRQLLSVLGGAVDLPADYYCSWLERVQNMNACIDKAVLPDETYARYPAFDLKGEGCITETIWITLKMKVSDFREAADRAETTPKEILTIAALKALSEYNKSSKVVVNWFYSGRDMSVKQNMVGLLMTSIPVPVDLDSDAARTDLKEEIRRIEKINIAYADLSPGNFGSRPVIDDTMTVNYIPCDEREAIEKTEGLERVELMESNKAYANVFYIIAEEISYGSPFTLLIRYNLSMYRRDSMERFRDIFIKKLTEALGMEEI